MKYSIIFTILVAAGFSTNEQNVDVAKVFSDAEQQTRLMLQNIPSAKKGNPDLVSPRTLENGELKLVASRDWTSGFFPGQLWFLYEFTGKDEWKQQARDLTANIEREKTNAGTHDMGFKLSLIHI